ncbi:MAG: heme-binding protein, partial [Planctomycetaceae bacterium]|nr:heme-binding protein [Planctomycetaceae bacterium]
MPTSKTCFAVWLLSATVWCLSTAFVVAQESADGKIFTQKPEVAPSAGKPVEEKSEKPKLNVFAGGPAPSWIWGADANKNYFVRKTFTGKAQFAFLRATCDNAMTVWVNGQKIAASDAWDSPVDSDIKSLLKPGENVIEAEIVNAGGIAGFCAKIVLLDRNGSDRFLVTDDSWNVAEKRDAKEWAKARIVAKLEGHPGGKNFVDPNSGDSAVPRDTFNLLPGFQVEKLFTVPKEKLGSWVNITTDPKGRLIVSDQGNLGFCRVTPPPIRSEPQRASGGSEVADAETKVEHLDIRIDGKQMSGAQGLLWAFDSLYVVCNGGPGSGLYRCKDTDGDDQFDKVEKLRDIPGGGEHGPHAIRLSPDGKSLYVIAGNHTKMPFEIKTNAPPQTMGGQRTEQLRATLPEGVTSRLMPNWDEDVLLPRYWDPSGHAAGVLAP